MTERINGSLRPADTAGTRRTDAAKPAGGAGEGVPSTAQSGDSVNLTRSGLLMSKLEEVVHGLPVKAGYVLWTTGYGAAYIAALLLAATIIFSRRDFK